MENQTSVTWTRARELSDIPLAHAATALCAQRRKRCQKMFFPQISILQTFRGKTCCGSDGSEQCLPSDLWIWPLRQSQLTAGPVHHKHWCHPTVSGNQSWAGRGKHRAHGLADVSEAAVTLTLSQLAHEELPPSGTTEHKCQSSGHSTDLSGA